MFFRQLLHEEKSCLSYIIGCSSKGVAAVIDPQVDIDKYLGITKKYKLQITHVIETHVQADHLSGARQLGEVTKSQIFYYENARVRFPHQKLCHNEVIQIGNRIFKILATPGHTQDSMSIYVDDWFVLTGDTLFVGDVGRVDLSLENNLRESAEKAEKLYQSLFKVLLKLPDDTEIYPGHFGGSSCGKHMDGKPVSTIGFEKRNNYALQMTSRQEFVRVMTADVPPPPKSFREIKRKNLGT